MRQNSECPVDLDYARAMLAKLDGQAATVLQEAVEQEPSRRRCKLTLMNPPPEYSFMCDRCNVRTTAKPAGQKVFVRQVVGESPDRFLVGSLLKGSGGGCRCTYSATSDRWLELGPKGLAEARPVGRALLSAELWDRYNIDLLRMLGPQCPGGRGMSAGLELLHGAVLAGRIVGLCWSEGLLDCVVMDGSAGLLI